MRGGWHTAVLFPTRMMMSSSTTDTNSTTQNETKSTIDVRQMSTPEIFAAIRRIYQQRQEKQQEIERREREQAEAQQAAAREEAPKSMKSVPRATGVSPVRRRYPFAMPLSASKTPARGQWHTEMALRARGQWHTPGTTLLKRPRHTELASAVRCRGLVRIGMSLRNVLPFRLPWPLFPWHPKPPLAKPQSRGLNLS